MPPFSPENRRHASWRTLAVGGIALLAVALARTVEQTHSLHRLLQVALVVLAGASVAVADALIKRASNTESIWLALRTPSLMIAVALYLVQILVVTYVFIKNWNLGVVGLVQMAVYASVVVFVGITFFQEHISRTQEIGMALAFFGAILMNL